MRADTYLDAIREYYRRNKYLSSLIDEMRVIDRAEPFEGARIRPARQKHLLKLFKYKRRAKGRRQPIKPE